MTVDEVRAALRKACEKAGSLRAWARSRGVSPAYVSDVLLGQRAPGPAILEALGLEVERTEKTVYRRRK
jgi:hypothetical protein